MVMGKNGFFQGLPKKLTLSTESAAGLDKMQVSFQNCTICSRHMKTTYCLFKLLLFYLQKFLIPMLVDFISCRGVFVHRNFFCNKQLF